MTDDREQIREMYRRYWRCMIDKDADGLRGLMAEIARLDRGVRYYHRTDAQLVQFAAWQPSYEAE